VNLLRSAILVAVMIAVPFVVRTREPRSQAAALGFYGLLLALAFAFYEAPDVSLAQLAIGAVALPFMVLLALSRVRRQAELRAEREGEER
jgi:energy-converting hydrogenase B subunit D